MKEAESLYGDPRRADIHGRIVNALSGKKLAVMIRLGVYFGSFTREGWDPRESDVDILIVADDQYLEAVGRKNFVNILLASLEEQGLVIGYTAGRVHPELVTTSEWNTLDGDDFPMQEADRELLLSIRDTGWMFLIAE